MLGKRKLILDTFCEVYDLLRPWQDGDFFDFSKHNIVPGAVYLIGRAQMNRNRDKILELIENDVIKVILSNPAEGSSTLRDHCDYVHKCGELVRNKRMLLIGGGDMDSEWPCLQYDSFLPKILDYKENILAIEKAKKIYTQPNKPYKFLFLNGRSRSHRKYLLERFSLNGLLDQALWSNLESRVADIGNITLWHKGQDLMLIPGKIKLLPAQYEVDRYRTANDKLKEEKLPNGIGFVKTALFGSEWGEIYLEPAPYIDTYFSLVTETVFDYPYSFRTEKIWKPIAMGHPWIAVANAGYYRDMHGLGFRTFGHLIDETFDQIQDSQKRIERIVEVVNDLCQQDLASFLNEAKDICKYNQQHFAEISVKVRKEFPDRFLKFVEQYQFNE
jgi:hypothetical protein